MASTHPLIDGWILTDGILDPIVLAEPMPVLPALQAAEILPNELWRGMESVRHEWIQARAWRYELAFEAPEEDDERCFLCFEHLAGEGALWVNGANAGEFSRGAWRADITGFLLPGRNCLAVCFSPCVRPLPGASSPLSDVGIRAPSLETSSYLTIERMGARALTEVDAFALAVRYELTAHSAGKYVFRYLLLADGEPVAKRDVYERLPAAQRTLSHRLEGLVTPYSPAKPEEGIYTVRICVERNGLTCERFDFEAAFPPRAGETDMPCFGARVNGPTPAPDTLRFLRALPLSYLRTAADGAPPRVTPPYRYGFPTPEIAVTADAPTLLTPPLAMPVGARISAMAGAEPYWPPERPVWRLSGSPRPPLAEYEERFGAGAGSSVERLSRLSRMLQAERVASLARMCRARALSFELDCVDESHPMYASGALIEYGGGARPAYWALRDACKPILAFGEMPPDACFTAGEVCDVPIWLLDEGTSALRSVAASLYALDGALLAGASYPALSAWTKQVATMRLALPDAPGVLLLRLEVRDEGGALLSRNDQLLVTAAKNEPPMGALLNPPDAHVITTQTGLLNDGTAIAIALSTNGHVSALWKGYGALLPGESLPLDNVREDDWECYNAM